MQLGPWWCCFYSRYYLDSVNLHSNYYGNMKNLKWPGITGALLLVYACWTPWVTIASKGITITGVAAEGTSYGKPGALHLILVCLFIIFSMIPRLWAKRFNLLVTGLNTAWMLRNFLVLSLCRAGECPEKQWGIYLVLVSSILMLLGSFFPEETRTR